MTDPAELAALAAGVEESPVTIVPAFGGLGAPWWDEGAVGLISNLTLGSQRADLAYAALDAIGQQVADVVEAVDRGVGQVRALYVDGGPTVNEQLMQLQAELVGRPVLRSRQAELSALGAAHLAGLGAGLWGWTELEALPRQRDTFTPRREAAFRRDRRRRWQEALGRARSRQPDLSRALVG